MYKYFTLVLCVLLMSSCKSSQQKAYEAALATAVQLIENDTVNLAVGANVSKEYRFSAGVEDKHYKLSYLNSKPEILEFLSKEEFYLGAQDIVGGPSVGVLLFKGLKDGLARLDFYNSYQNEERIRAEMLDYNFRKSEIIQQFSEVLAYPAITNKWLVELQEEPPKEWAEKMPEALKAIDSLMKIHLMTYTYNEAVQPLLDSLYTLPWLERAEQWKSLKGGESPKIHRETELRTYYIRVTTK